MCVYTGRSKGVLLNLTLFRPLESGADSHEEGEGWVTSVFFVAPAASAYFSRLIFSRLWLFAFLVAGIMNRIPPQNSHVQRIHNNGQK